MLSGIGNECKALPTFLTLPSTAEDPARGADGFATALFATALFATTAEEAAAATTVASTPLLPLAVSRPRPRLPPLALPSLPHLPPRLLPQPGELEPFAPFPPNCCCLVARLSVCTAAAAADETLGLRLANSVRRGWRRDGALRLDAPARRFEATLELSSIEEAIFQRIFRFCSDRLTVQTPAQHGCDDAASGEWRARWRPARYSTGHEDGHCRARRCDARVCADVVTLAHRSLHRILQYSFLKTVC